MPAKSLFAIFIADEPETAHPAARGTTKNGTNNSVPFLFAEKFLKNFSAPLASGVGFFRKMQNGLPDERVRKISVKSAQERIFRLLYLYAYAIIAE